MLTSFNPFVRKANYYETDKMAIVHHSNYIRWLEESRIDMLEQAGYPFERMEAEGVLMPVLEVECAYKYPIRFGDTFEIIPQVFEFNGCKMSLKYEIYNITAGRKLSATALSKHCLTDENMHPIRSQKSHPDIFNIFNNALIKNNKK